MSPGCRCVADDLPPLAEAPPGAAEAEGWLRRFVAAPPRLEEMCRTYASLGLEVRLEGVRPEELSGGCAGCAVAASHYRVIYTRRPA